MLANITATSQFPETQTIVPYYPKNNLKEMYWKDTKLLEV